MGIPQTFSVVMGILICVEISTKSFAQSSPCNPSVQTKVGKFCGVEENIKLLDNAKVDAYLGIRFAKAPNGALRFKRPEPFNSNPNMEFKATKYGCSCPQVLDEMFQSSAAARMWVPQDCLDEDCLFLNVWVPKTRSMMQEKTEKLAVLVWIYGGGFYSGASSLKVYDGKYIAANQNIIVVSMNYRLGAFGFLYLSDSTIAGNMGLWDQRLAMKWVKDNIAEFGGDPDRITLVGESAGSVSVNAHVISPWSQNLFRNAIMQSGSVYGYWALMPKEAATNATDEFVRNVNCKYESHEATAECLQQKDVDTLNEATNTMFKGHMAYFSVPFCPVTDGDFLPYPEPRDLKELRFLKPSGSLMFGINMNESSYFLLYAFMSEDQFHMNPESLDIPDRKTYLSILQKMLDLPPEEPDEFKDISLKLTDMEYLDERLRSNATVWTDMVERMGSDRTFKCPTIKMAQSVINRKRGSGHFPTLPTYFYEFQYRTKSLPMPKWMGTMHGYEIEYVFGMPFSDEFQRNFYKFDDEERIVSEMMMTYWGNFVRTGDPNILPDGRHILELRMDPDRNAMEDSALNRLIGSNPAGDPSMFSRVQSTLAPTYHSGEPRVPMQDGEPQYSSQINNVPFKAWPEFTNNTEAFLIFGQEPGWLGIGQRPRNRQCIYWHDVYPSILKRIATERMKCQRQFSNRAPRSLTDDFLNMNQWNLPDLDISGP